MAEELGATHLQLVLDTNVCLDWLVFKEPAVRPLAQALTDRRATLLTCPAMRQELAHMLWHPSLARWNPDAAAAMTEYDRHATLLPPPQPSAGARLACSDPDDQVFIDLAVTQGATYLMTHDRALLKLARRARALGVRVIRPRDWIEATVNPARPPDPAESSPPARPPSTPIGR